MKIVAEVFKSGESLAIRLPNTLKINATELVIESGRDGSLILYDPQERERAEAKRQKAWEELCRLPPLETELELERP